MRRVLVIGFSVVVVAATVGVALLVDRDPSSERKRVGVTTALVARNASALAQIALPEGWQQLDNAETVAPVQLLVVGTTERPDDDPIGGCDPSATLEPGAAFVSIYEYLTGATLNAPDHSQVYLTTQFISRPEDFGTVAPAGPLKCFVPEPSSTTIPTGEDALPSGDGSGVVLAASQRTQVADYTFLDTGRFFVARVVVSGDPDGTRFQEALGVLNSLDITPPPEVTTTTDPTATTTTLVAGDVDPQAVANEAITDALRGAFGGGGPRSGDEAVAGGFPLGEAASAAARIGNESFIGVIVPRVNWVTLDTATHATMNFDLLIDGRTITANTTGEALFIDGSWKITAESFCVVARRGGVACPAR